MTSTVLSMTFVRVDHVFKPHYLLLLIIHTQHNCRYTSHHVNVTQHGNILLHPTDFTHTEGIPNFNVISTNSFCGHEISIHKQKNKNNEKNDYKLSEEWRHTSLPKSVSHTSHTTMSHHVTPINTDNDELWVKTVNVPTSDTKASALKLSVQILNTNTKPVTPTTHTYNSCIIHNG